MTTCEISSPYIFVPFYLEEKLTFFYSSQLTSLFKKTYEIGNYNLNDEDYIYVPSYKIRKYDPIDRDPSYRKTRLEKITSLICSYLGLPITQTRDRFFKTLNSSTHEIPELFLRSLYKTLSLLYLIDLFNQSPYLKKKETQQYSLRSILELDDLALKQESYTSLLTSITHQISDFQGTIQTLPQIVPQITLIRSDRFKKELEWHSKCLRIIHNQKQSHTKQSPFLPCRGIDSLHNIFLIHSHETSSPSLEFLFKIGKEDGTSQELAYELATLLSLEELVPRSKKGSLNFLQLYKEEFIDDTSMSTGITYTDIKGYFIEFEKEAIPILNRNTTYTQLQVTQTLKSIEPFLNEESLIKAMLFSIIVGHGDLKNGSLHNANTLFIKKNDTPLKIDIKIIDYEFSFPESNLISHEKEGNGVSPYRCYFLFFDLMQKPLSQHHLELIKSILLQWDTETIKKRFQKKRTLSQRQKDALFERFDKVQKYFLTLQPKKNFRDLVYAIFPLFRTQDILLMQHHIPRLIRYEYIGISTQKKLEELVKKT